MRALKRRAGEIYGDYPTTFWTLVGATFVDRLGAAVLFPFFALYVTARFGVGMTQAGFLFTIFAVAGIAGGTAGGALADHFGRRQVVIFGLVSSALSTLTIGLVGDLGQLYGLALFAGIFSRIGRPAREAMVADLLPAAQHAEGYGVMRVVNNLAIALGAGLIMDNLDPRLVWYAGAGLALAAGLGFLLVRGLRPPAS